MGYNVNELTEQAMALLDKEVQLPDGVELAQGSMMEMMYDEFAAIGKALLIAIYLVFAVMAIQFESLRFSIVVIISVPFALVGSFLGLAVTGSSVNMASLLGLVMLVGIVVNNAIVLIDYANILRREEGLPTREALVRAGRMRLRPILMSSLTTIVGLMPMAVGSGVEMMESMAIVVIGGLLMSTLLTLILIPTFYLIFDKEDRRQRREEKRARKEAKKAARAGGTDTKSQLIPQGVTKRQDFRVGGPVFAYGRGARQTKGPCSPGPGDRALFLASPPWGRQRLSQGCGRPCCPQRR